MSRGLETPVSDKLREDVVLVPPGCDAGPPEFPRDPFGRGDDDRVGPPVSNAHLGMLMFLGAEAMFFAGLIGTLLVFRLGSVIWPPPGQPYLPIGVTGVNTAILLFSAYTMHRAIRAIRGEDRQALVRWLQTTSLLGTIFLTVQGYEWMRLVHFGFTLSSGTYGATFYTLIGTHGVHVFGAVLWLLIVLAGARRNRFSATRHVRLTVCAMYWYFVVGLWPVLYTLVYLS